MRGPKFWSFLKLFEVCAPPFHEKAGVTDTHSAALRFRKSLFWNGQRLEMPRIREAGQGSVRRAVHHRRRGGYPAPLDPPPPQTKVTKVT